MSPFAAVIDIGSNSVRLVIYRIEGRSIWPLVNEKVLAGLGRDLKLTGCLHPQGRDVAMTALRRFRAIVETYDLDQLHVVATAAVREASDGPDFVAKVASDAGFTVRVLTGTEEAHYAAQGVVCGHADAEGIVGDLGGSSLELISLRAQGDGGGLTLPLGPFALGAPAPVDPPRTEALIREILTECSGQFRGGTLHAVGGAWRSLALIWMQRKNYPLEVIQQFEMSARDGLSISRLVSSQSASSLERTPGISRRRMENIAYAAMVMQGLIEVLHFERICFSAYGLREGLLYEAMPAHLRREDPLIAGCSALGQRLGVNDNFGAALAAWALDFYGSGDLAAPPLRLIRAAAKLADIGARLHPDHRADLAADQVLRAPIPGQNHFERVFLAATIYARYSGDPYMMMPILIDRVLGADGLEQATRLGLLLRLGCDLSAKSPKLLGMASARQDGDGLALSAQPGWEDLLLGEQTQKRARALAQTLKPTARIVNF